MLGVIKIIEENIPEVWNDILHAWLPKNIHFFQKSSAGMYSTYKKFWVGKIFLFVWKNFYSAETHQIDQQWH